MGAIFTDVGLDIVAKRMKGQGTEPLFIGWGTGTTAPAATDAALQAEDNTGGYARVAGASTVVSIAVADDAYQVSGSITALAALVITEWALFDAANGGHMICREVNSPGFSLGVGDTLNFVFKIQNARCGG